MGLYHDGALRACGLHRIERLYERLWSRRGGGAASSAGSPQGGNATAAHSHGNSNGRWLTASELTYLQRRVADLAAELEVCGHPVRNPTPSVHAGSARDCRVQRHAVPEKLPRRRQVPAQPVSASCPPLSFPPARSSACCDLIWVSPAVGLQDHKGVSATMLDALTQQLNLAQQLATLQQSRIERVHFLLCCQGSLQAATRSISICTSLVLVF